MSSLACIEISFPEMKLRNVNAFGAFKVLHRYTLNGHSNLNLGSWICCHGFINQEYEVKNGLYYLSTQRPYQGLSNLQQHPICVLLYDLAMN